MKQRGAWEAPQGKGWSFFAVRHTDSENPAVLIQAPNNGKVRVFKRDGNVDFQAEIKVRHNFPD